MTIAAAFAIEGARRLRLFNLPKSRDQSLPSIHGDAEAG